MIKQLHHSLFRNCRLTFYLMYSYQFAQMNIRKEKMLRASTALETSVFREIPRGGGWPSGSYPPVALVLCRTERGSFAYVSPGNEEKSLERQQFLNFISYYLYKQTNQKSNILKVIVRKWEKCKTLSTVHRTDKKIIAGEM